MKKHCSLFFFLLLKFAVYAQPGFLDNTFGTGGKVTTAIGSGHDFGWSVAIQSDGKIVVAGDSYNGSNWDFALVRYNSDGSLDNTFGSSGKVTTATGNPGHGESSVAIQTNGKIVVAGKNYSGIGNSYDYDFALVRYNSNGSLDNAFGSGGKVTTTIGSYTDWAFSVAIQTDGKIVVAGWSSGSIVAFALVRYNSNGTLDNTFGSGGKVITAIGSSNAFGYSVAIQSDGKIVVAGTNNNDFALVRYNINGSLDTTFGSGGKVTTANGIALSVVIQSDAKIVVSGNSWNGSNYDFGLVRYNSNGSLDNTFGSGGKITTAIGSGHDCGWSVAIQGDGKIVVAGTSGIFPNYDFGLVRYNSNGSLDNTFGSSGKVLTDFSGSSDDYCYSAAIQSDGKIVLAGSSKNGFYGDFAVARYDGSTVGVEEKTEMSDVIIFPNPSSGIFTIDFKNKTAETKICIYDVLGNCILNKMSVKNNNQEIDFSNQSKGIYFIEVETGTKRINKKIVLN